jgi:hypothetical protein
MHGGREDEEEAIAILLCAVVDNRCGSGGRFGSICLCLLKLGFGFGCFEPKVLLL